MSEFAPITQKKLIVIFVVMFAACLTQVASDVYAPSLLTITKVFGTELSYAQLSMSIYMVAVSISQIIYGPISEGIGRRKPLLFGMALMTVGSIMCVYAESIQTLIIGRVVQGLGAGGCAGLWRAIYRDAFDMHEMVRYGSYIVMFIMFIIPAAPVLGGYLEENYGWNANFVFMSLYSIFAMILVSALLHETSKYHHVERLRPHYIVQTTKKVISHPRFMGIAFAIFLTYGALFSWIIKAPIMLIDVIGLSPTNFGLVTFASCILAYPIAGLCNAKLGPKLGFTTMLRIGWSMLLFSGISMIIAYLINGFTIYSIMIPITLLYFGSTIIWPNAGALAFEPIGKVAGYGSAIYSSMQLGGAGIISAIISHLPSTPLVLGLFIIIASVIAWASFEYVKDSEGEIE